MSLPPKLQTIIDELTATTDRDERFEMLIEYSDQFEPVPASVATRPFPENHKVPGCESEVYVWATKNPDGTVKIYYAVENPQGISAKATAVILDQGLSGEPPEAFANVNEDIALSIFGGSLSMGKGQGLMSMVGATKALAMRLR
jgi:cysteine desulfuration protein SufE